MKELENNLGPEYAALMEGLQDSDPESEDGRGHRGGIGGLVTFAVLGG
jgi:hypothetical protein